MSNYLIVIFCSMQFLRAHKICGFRLDKFMEGYTGCIIIIILYYINIIIIIIKSYTEYHVLYVFNQLPKKY